jgi:hypothetical protein
MEDNAFEYLTRKTVALREVELFSFISLIHRPNNPVAIWQ